MPDLLPDDFGTATVTPPRTILREQANHLARKTRGLVEGLVQLEKALDGFVHTFYLLAPALDNYTYRLFQVEHAIPMYPATISAGKDIEYTAKDEKELLEHLKKIFASSRTREVVQALMAQSQTANI